MRAAALLAVSAVLLIACGEDETPSASTTSPTTKPTGATGLEIRHDDGAGRETSGALVCGPGEQRATGDLAGGRPAADLCRDARALATLLTKEPGRRACTQIYGGPQTVKITGTIDGRSVDRRFTRTNGCETEEYARLRPILPPNR